MTPREEMLLRMYEQMFNDIDRQIMIVWHSISAIVGAFAVLALVEKDVIPLDVAASLFMLLAAWVVAHALDASYWYNRNLVIIANIERQFLFPSDLNEVSCYFAKHRDYNKMLTHLRIQVALAFGLAGTILVYHFWKNVFPGFGYPLTWENIEFLRATPYLAALVAVYYLGWLNNDRNRSYAEFVKNSPGKTIGPPPQPLVFGVGHGGEKNFWNWWIGARDKSA
jgi:hypothetical protein